MAQTKMEPKSFIEKQDTLAYLLKRPNQISNETYPLIIWLHGSGEKGRDNKKQYCNGLEILDKTLEQPSFQSYLCAPQCPQNTGWAYYDLKEDTHSFISQAPLVQKQLIDLIQNLIKQYPIDPK